MTITVLGTFPTKKFLYRFFDKNFVDIPVYVHSKMALQSYFLKIKL